ncbi:MAG: sulfotransferase [Chromatiaceae bacterium]|nr:sulfotransferase [Chromatiaceae bacterium]
MSQPIPLTSLASLRLMLRRGQLSDVEAQCRQWLNKPPVAEEMCGILFRLLHQQRRFSELLELSQQLTSHQPELLIAWQAQLKCLRQLQRHAEAISINKQLLQRFADVADLWLLQGILLKDSGQLDAALAHLQRAIQLQPNLYEAYWLRADLLKSPTDADIRDMQQQLASCQNDTAAAPLHYALASALERQQQFADSFTQLQRGAAAKKRTLHYNHQQELEEYRALMQTFPEPGQLSQAANGSTPVFICGLPRSGTTLVEQILSSHHDVTAGDELFELAQATAKTLSEQQNALRFPHWTTQLNSQQWQQLGERYLQLTSRLQQSRYFTDKMPLNYKAIGIIRAALPQAKIIYCQRHPLDTLLSCFKHLFGEGIAFSYDLDHLADIFIAQQQLMTHWLKRYPEHIYVVTYETLVMQQRQQTEQLLAFLDLPWSEHCIQFHTNQRAVYTVSNSQVRQPLFSSSIGSWQRYQQQLQPLIQRLQPYVEQYQAMLCSKN